MHHDYLRAFLDSCPLSLLPPLSLEVPAMPTAAAAWYSGGCSDPGLMPCRSGAYQSAPWAAWRGLALSLLVLALLLRRLPTRTASPAGHSAWQASNNYSVSVKGA